MGNLLPHIGERHEIGDAPLGSQLLESALFLGILALM